MAKTREEIDEALERFKSDHDYRDIVSWIENTLQGFADQNAAMAWSTPTDEMTEEFGPDVTVIASFGDMVATNGDPGHASVPKGYVLVKGGGRVPVAEEEVLVEQAIHAVAEDLKIPQKLVKEIAAAEGMKEYAYVSVSGETEVYAKRGKK